MLTQPTFGPRAAALNIQFNDTALLLRRRGLKLAQVVTIERASVILL